MHGLLMKRSEGRGSRLVQEKKDRVLGFPLFDNTVACEVPIERDPYGLFTT